MSKIVKAGGLSSSFERWGVTEEDQAAINSAMASGISFERAAEELGYSAPEKKGAIAKREGAPIESPRVNHPESAFVETGAEIESIEEDAYKTGQQIIQQARNVRRKAFAQGIEDELGQGAEEDNQFFRETANGGIAALRFRTSRFG